jgi:hypothetical protein
VVTSASSGEAELDLLAEISTGDRPLTRASIELRPL